MDFGFTEEQELLRAEVRKFLDQSCPMSEVRRISEAGAGLPGPLWKQVAELGWPGLTIPEEHGGAGLGFEDLVVVLEETGRSLFPAPLLSTTLAAAAIREAGSAEQQARWLPRIAEGSAIGTLAYLEADDIQGPEGVQLRASDGGTLESGEKLFVESTVSVLKDASGGRIGMLAVIRDVTRRKRAEEELERHRQRLEQMVGARTADLNRINEQLQRQIRERD